MHYRVSDLSLPLGAGEGALKKLAARRLHVSPERIASLEKLKEAPPEGWAFDGGQVVVNTEENRVQLIYDEKPDADTRAKLKANGFRWAPSQKAWQRQLNSAGMYAAREVAPPVEG